MKRCPLCDSQLIGAACPVCTAAAVNDEPNTLRDPPRVKRGSQAAPVKRRRTLEEIESWYAAAGMVRPAPAAPERTDATDPYELAPAKAPEDRGDVPTAFLLIAVVVGHLLSLGLAGKYPGGLFMGGLTDVVFVVTAIGLLKGSTFARWMVLVSLALGFVGAGLLAIHSVVAGIAAVVPLFLAIATMLSHERRIRLIAAGLGAAVALGTPMLSFMLPEKDPLGDITRHALPNGQYRDNDGVEVRAPRGVLLFDPSAPLKIRHSQPPGPLKLLLAAQDSLGSTTPQVLFLAREGDLGGFLQFKELPSHVPLDRKLDALHQIIGGSRPRAERNDLVIPPSLKRLEHQGWQASTPAGTLYVAVARMPDGRSLLAACTSLLAPVIAERRCAEVFSGISFAP